MRPGILIQHANRAGPAPGFVRSDVAGFIGVIGPQHWPEGAEVGDFVDVELHGRRELLDGAHDGFDPASLEAVLRYFDNGGAQCRLLGVCVQSLADVLEPQPAANPLGPLIGHLRGEESIGILAMPLLAWLRFTVERGRTHAQSTPLVHGLLNHCREVGHRFLLVDPPRGLHEGPLLDWVGALRDRAGDSAAFGAVFYPWLLEGETPVPPSGAVAGLMAQVELANAPLGVRWPPANQPVQGVTHADVALRWNDLEPLVDAHVNPLLVQPGRGLVLWGARTLSRDPRWRYINARRIVSALTEQLRRDAEWLVFERQGPELWQLVERTVRTRLDEAWSAGMLTDDGTGQQYLVRCDAELNPPEIRDAGQVQVKVHLQPVGTTEQIVIDLRLGP